MGYDSFMGDDTKIMEVSALMARPRIDGPVAGALCRRASRSSGLWSLNPPRIALSHGTDMGSPSAGRHRATPRVM